MENQYSFPGCVATDGGLRFRQARPQEQLFGERLLADVDRSLDMTTGKLILKSTIDDVEVVYTILIDTIQQVVELWLGEKQGW